MGRSLAAPSGLDGTQRVFGLDFLRASAICMVLVSHAYHFVAPHVAGLERLDVAGYLGVELFFVLSGFLIGSILLRREDTIKNFGAVFDFYKRRWARTLPNYYFFLFLNVLVFSALNKRIPDFTLFLFFGQNLSWPHPVFFPEAWSLAVEEWFYLLLPLLLLLLLRLKVSLRATYLSVTFAFIVGPLILRLFSVEASDPSWDQGVRKIVVLRFDSLMFGLLAAIARQSFLNAWERFAWPVAVIAGVLLWVAVLRLDGLDVNADWYARTLLFSHVSIAFALLLPLANRFVTAPNNVFALIVTKLALWSYSLYLCNLMVLTVMFQYWRGHITSSFTFAWFGLTTYLVLCIAISALTYRYVELPLMLRGRSAASR